MFIENIEELEIVHSLLFLLKRYHKEEYPKFLFSLFIHIQDDFFKQAQSIFKPLLSIN